MKDAVHFDLGKIAKVASAPLFALAGPSSQGGYGSVAIRRLIELLVLFDMLAVLIGISVSGPRGLFAMARDRRLPAFLAAVSAKRGTPVGANIFVVACYAVWALLTVFWTGLFALPATPHYSAMFSWGSTRDQPKRRCRLRRGDRRDGSQLLWPPTAGSARMESSAMRTRAGMAD
jgi:amino acid transporter